MQEWVAVRRALVECRKTYVHRARVERQAARQKMLEEIRSALRQHRFQIVASVLQIRNNCRRMLKNIASTEDRGGKLAANGGTSCGQTRVSFGINRRLVAGVRQEENVLRAVRSHPEGIRLVEMGNEVGVDWRRLVQPVQTLADAGRIEQFDELFYPVT